MTTERATGITIPSGGPGRGVMARLRYWRRIFAAYYGGGQSHLTFWHGVPEVNLEAEPGHLDQYWQRFAVKADYPGQFDAGGIPMLDYRGHVGLQYNPIAIAQYALGNYNRYRWDGDERRRATFLTVCDWLADNLRPNAAGLEVWTHEFDWEYRTPLSKGWYSCLSQGQAISALVRAHLLTEDSKYLSAATRALIAFQTPVEAGGVSYWDEAGNVWFEETVVDPPTHILNGFIWASWGMYDLWLHTGDEAAGELWREGVRTLRLHLDRFDIGYWSLYDEAGLALSNAASGFYHALHIVQLRILYRLTQDPVFRDRADRWDAYRNSAFGRRRAWLHKAVFKLLYY